MWTEYYNFNTHISLAILPPIMGLLLTLFCLYAVRFTWKEKKSGKNKDRLVLPFLFACTAFGLLWTVGVTRELGSKYFDYRSALNQHRYQEVEGRVENYNAHAIGRQFEESFTVRDVEFHYSPYSLFGFRQTQRRGGALDNGVYLRIHHYKGKILRLWIRA